MQSLCPCALFKVLPARCLSALALIVGFGLMSAVSGQDKQVKLPEAPPVSSEANISPKEAEARALDQKLIDDAKKSSSIMTNLAYISDVIGPRLTGSANLKRANEYTAQKMKEYGLVNVKLEPWTIPQGWERGTATCKLLEPNAGRTITVASSAWAPGTKGKIEGPVVVVQANNREELEKYKGKLKNAIVLRGAPPEIPAIFADRGGPLGSPAAGGGGGGGARGGNRGGRRGGDQAKGGEQKAGEQKAGEQKAAQQKGGEQKAATPPAQPPLQNPNFGGNFAFQQELNEFLRTEGVAAFMSDSRKPQGLVVTGGSWRGRDRATAAEPIAQLSVAHEHYAMLYRLATRPGDAVTRVELEVSNKFIDGPITVYNTVGEITGSEKPNEFVVLGAHLDSWDLGTGTTDNGTGSCTVLECARLLAQCGVKPKRTIRFVLFSGEEQGLHGSRAYCASHKDEMERTSMCLVHDTGTGKVTGIGCSGFSAARALLEKELVSLAPLGCTNISLASMGGSDHASFNAVGAPGFYCIQESAGYPLTHHTQTDTFDKAQEPNLIGGAQVMSVTAMRVANLAELLPRERAAGGGGFGGGGGRRGGADKGKVEEKKDKGK